MNKIKEKILFKTYSGSKLYGTNNENSDTDFKGIFLPDINDLILEKAPKHYVFNTSNKLEKNNKNDIDETYYSLQYFLELAAKGETNCIDLLFANSNNNAVLETSPIWEELTNNYDKIITKNMNAYLGYCKSQCQKYSIKGDKLNNYNSFLKMCKLYYDEKDKNGAPETLYNIISKAFNLNNLNNYIPKVGEDRVKVNFNDKVTNFNFGDHCYFVTANNKESYISISDIKFILTDSIKSAYHKCKKVISSYGKRAQAAANEDGTDLKAISHCVRVLFQVEEILETGKITFPLKSADFIKSIKYNTNKMTRDEIMDWIEKKIEHINYLIKKSTLREKADFNWINNFILKCYNI